MAAASLQSVLEPSGCSLGEEEGRWEGFHQSDRHGSVQIFTSH